MSEGRNNIHLYEIFPLYLTDKNMHIAAVKFNEIIQRSYYRSKMSVDVDI